MTIREIQTVLKTIKASDEVTEFIGAEIVNVKDINTKFGEKTLLTFNHNDEKQQLFVNADSMNNLIEAYGENDKSWIGKLINISVEIDEQYNKEKLVITSI